jgi:catechol 2,3-dioxygenase-like lactoylglutathione lyase family enzyme
MTTATRDAAGPPPLEEVLETVLYTRDVERAEAFYSGTLGLRLLSQEPGRSLFYRAGASVLLLFDARRTREGGALPAHGAAGSVHTCLRVAPAEYERWKAWLLARGVAILQEVAWEQGHSFYFRDPDGNLLEIANEDIWPP